MSTKNDRNVQIVAGPDMFKIVSRLVDGSSMGEGDDKQRSVRFKLVDGGQEWEEHVRLLSLAREDGSGKNWIIEGYTVANSARVRLFYTLHNRTGHFTFIAR